MRRLIPILVFGLLTTACTESREESPQTPSPVQPTPASASPASSAAFSQPLADDFIAELATTLPPPQRKVLIIGLDGLEWKLILPMVERGRLPNLDRLMRAGTWGVMDTINPILSPLIWTSMATGVTPDIHGVLDFVEIDPESGEFYPISGRSRREPALWNIASIFSRSVSVVGWWATWPAERINGVMVSDRLYYTLTEDINPELFREDPPHMVFPAAAAGRFTTIREQALEQTDWARLHSFMAVSQSAYDRAVASGAGMADPVDGFRRILASTSTYFNATFDVAEDRPDLLVTYIQATDEINHVLAPYVSPPTIDIDPGEAAALAAAVPAYFEHVDQLLGRLLDLCPISEYAVLLVSDHGTRWGRDRPRNLPASNARTALFWHSPDAVYVMAGKGVARLGRQARRSSVYDVAPTTMALLGLPPGLKWQGDLLPGVTPTRLESVDYSAHLPAESYRPVTDTKLPSDPEYIAKLRALGYLGDEAVTASAERSETSGVRISANATPSSLNNLGLVMIDKQQYDEAESCLRAAIERSPDYAAPHNNLRKLYMKTGRYDAADRELWLAIDKGSTIPEVRINQAATAYEKLGREDRVATVLTEAVRRFPAAERFWIELLRIKMNRGECREAKALGMQAAEHLPNRPAIHAFLGMAAGCSGDLAAARAALERSLALDPDQPELRHALARIPES